MNNPARDNTPVTIGLPEVAEAPVSLRSRLSPWWPAALFLGLFWLLVFNQQRLEWTVNVVYAYGWAVPFLALYLLWERWRHRPEAGEPLAQAAVIPVVMVLLLGYLPLRVIQEANPDWVKINWIIYAVCGGMTVMVFAAVGGWSYVRNFFFPVLFCLTALPWPTWMGDSLIQGLMRGNAAICAELLSLGGMPAMAEGNLIQIAGHSLNVEEACSGIRSLQTAFMMSLFLGEFYRMGLIRRGVLLLSSFAVAFVINLARTVALAIFTSRGKGDEMHDTVGNIAMVLCLVGLWLLSDLLNRKPVIVPLAKPEESGEMRRPFPVWVATAGLLWLIAVEGLTAAWYAPNETGVANTGNWTIAWPKDDPTYRQGSFADTTRSILKYNDASIARWAVGPSYVWDMYFIQWNPGRVSKYLSRAHYPTVCLPASGLKLVSETGLWECKVKDVVVPFNTYVFSQGDREVYVFHAILEDRPGNAPQAITYGQVGATERIQSVLRRERNLGQRVIGISLNGPSSPSEARERVASVMSKLIVKQSPLAALTTP